MLKKFFAVTLTSIYSVTSDTGRGGWPEITKLAYNCTGGEPYDTKYCGPLVSVGRNIVTYSPIIDEEGHPVRNIDDIPQSYWFQHTSLVVALFIKEEEARDCFQEKNLKSLDSRWCRNTRDVLSEIESTHPTFTLPRTLKFALVDDITNNWLHDNHMGI